MSACMFTAMVRGCPLPPITKYQLVLVFVARFKARPRQVSCPPCPAVSLDLALRATLHPLIIYDSSCGLKSGSPRQSKVCHQWWFVVEKTENKQLTQSRPQFYISYFNCMKRRRWQWLPSQYCPAMLQITMRHRWLLGFCFARCCRRWEWAQSTQIFATRLLWNCNCSTGYILKYWENRHK